MRRGVTLVELLVTIMIISILAAAILGVAAVAGETARESKTRTIISRIHTLLLPQYNSYTTRRVKLRPEVQAAISHPELAATTEFRFEFTTNPAQQATAAQRGLLKAKARLFALREMMMTEMPDRWSDVLLNEFGGTALYPRYLDTSNTSNGRSELANLYLRTYQRLLTSENKLTGQRNALDDILANESAECLYLIVMNACGDGESRTLFPASSVGDTDGDGASEFLDGWGQPIEFVRWPVGFTSDVQLNANELDPLGAEEWQKQASADHDPLDLYQADATAFRTMPLVYSRGRDEESGVWHPTRVATVSVWMGIANRNEPLTGVPPILSPIMKYDDLTDNPDRGAYYLGTIDQSLATDNLHNHLIGTR